MIMLPYPETLPPPPPPAQFQQRRLTANAAAASVSTSSAAQQQQQQQRPAHIEVPPNGDCIQVLASPSFDPNIDLPVPMTPHEQRRRAALLAEDDVDPQSRRHRVIVGDEMATAAARRRRRKTQNPQNRHHGRGPRGASRRKSRRKRQSNSCCGVCCCSGHKSTSEGDESDVTTAATEAGEDDDDDDDAEVVEHWGEKLSRTFRGLKSRNVWKSILLGQLISLLLCLGSVLCQILVENYNVKLPAAQNLPHYLLLATVYLSLKAGGRCKRSRRRPELPDHAADAEAMMTKAAGDSSDSILTVLRRRGLRYFILALVDSQAGYLTNSAFQYTSLIGVQLLDCFSIPVLLVLSWLLLRARFKLTHIGGLALALMSVVTLVWIDVDDGKGGVSAGGKPRLIGDMMTLGGSLLTGSALVLIEHTSHCFDIFELLGLLGMFGTIITAIQAAALERSALLSVRWELWEISVLLVALSVAQFVRVSCISFMFRASSSAGLSLGLLATDVYTIAAGVFFFRYKFHWLYLVSLAMVFTGLLVFYLKPVPYLPANYKKKRAMEMRKSKRHSSRSASLGSKSSQTTLFTAGVEIETRRITTTTTQHSRHGSTTSIPMTDLNFCGSGPPSAVLPSELGPTVEIHPNSAAISPSTIAADPSGLRSRQSSHPMLAEQIM